MSNSEFGIANAGDLSSLIIIRHPLLPGLRNRHTYYIRRTNPTTYVGGSQAFLPLIAPSLQDYTNQPAGRAIGLAEPVPTSSQGQSNYA